MTDHYSPDDIRRRQEARRIAEAWRALTPEPKDEDDPWVDSLEAAIDDTEEP